MDWFFVFFVSLFFIALVIIAMIRIEMGYKVQNTYNHTDGEQLLNKDEQDILDLSNAYRKAEGLNELEVDWLLVKHAEKRLDYLIATNRFKRWKHVELLAAGGEKVGENTGRGKELKDLVINHWFDSRNHHKNIEGDWKYTGIAVKKYFGRYTYCQLFLR